jgi:hypothetical protein
MARVFDLLRVAGFDAESIEAICTAYVMARKPLRETGEPDFANEIIALRILSLAKQGERDPDRLCSEGLTALARVRLLNNVGLGSNSISASVFSKIRNFVTFPEPLTRRQP